MSITVTIVTTANRTRKFVQTDDAAIQEILATLRAWGQLFAQRTLIVASDQEVEVFSPASIARIEIETQRDLAGVLPQLEHAQLTRITAQAEMPPPALTETYISTRADIFFEGGDTVALWLAGPRPTENSDRLMRLNRLFEQTALLYKLPAGGVGFINPAVMTRAVFASANDLLPKGAWRLQPLA